MCNATVDWGCDNLLKSIFMAVEKPGELRDFFLLLCGRPGGQLNGECEELWAYLVSASTMI